jgi:Peptidase family M23
MPTDTGFIAFTNLLGKLLSTQWFQGKWTISQDYGPTTFTHEPAYGPYSHFHNGLDLSGAGIMGTPILAGVEAQITEIGYDKNGYGNYIKLTPTNAPDITILLGHLSDTLGNRHTVSPPSGNLFDPNAANAFLKGLQQAGQLKVGDAVHAGDIVGHVGSSGNSTGAHLHFAVFQNGTPINPVPYLTGTAPGQANAPLAHDSAAQKAAASPQNLLPNLPGPNFDTINKILTFISDPKEWWRILIVAVGVVLIFIGVTGYFAPRAAKVAPIPV